ncbi:ClpP/crotonase-like domain-containing protein [Polychytrium aggregatum]|uniref:ClpP/crotonase-like domain-containing protein n=1 Tax=Polychytrium aggregatum TaxID=110093 RepID=UPI0022FE0215|nr:ClpP/crotonase-like domain-containing protein [Polychytrium aggregatum]KAI9207233.1 ClpP/crotonase-like domain-containing protein [Polychytrium aggregatum]
MAQGLTDVKLEITPPLARITFCRPDSYNSFRAKTYQDLQAAMQTVARRDDVFVTVVTGEGKFFSSGADFNDAYSPVSADPIEVLETFRKHLGGLTVAVTQSFINHPKVLVIALNGPVVGIPAALISHADLIYASDSAYLYTPFATIGICAEGGSSFGFLSRMGFGPAMEALMFGRKYSAHELERFGFVNRVFPEASFHAEVEKLLKTNLAVSNLPTLLKTKELTRTYIRNHANLANAQEWDEVSKCFASGAPAESFKRMLQAKMGAKKSKL